jgi:ParB family chromosome partitioning protein
MSENPLHSSKTVEWYTPKWVIDRARSMMGSIDLDPASSEFANRIIRADKFYTESDNGLSRPWYGNVWLNPPYGRKTSIWIDKLISEWNLGNLNQAIVLINSVTDRKWFHILWMFPLCFVYNRIKFLDPFGIAQTSPTHGNVIIYISRIPLPENQRIKFYENYNDIGHIVIP